MAKKANKVTTDEALEYLLGKKAAKRLRRLAAEVMAADGKPKKKRPSQKK